MNIHHTLWILAVAFFGVGDVATTIYLVESGAGVEGHPLAAPVIDAFGVWITAPWKAAAFLVFYAEYRIAPQEWRWGVPLGLALFGAVLTAWNSVGWYLGQNPVAIF